MHEEVSSSNYARNERINSVEPYHDDAIWEKYEIRETTVESAVRA